MRIVNSALLFRKVRICLWRRVMCAANLRQNWAPRDIFPITSRSCIVGLPLTIKPVLSLFFFLKLLSVLLASDSTPMWPLMDTSGEPFQPLPSIWRMVEEHLAPSEKLEVKALLGEESVERSLELHTEVQTLLEFHQELQLGHGRLDPNLLQATDRWTLLAAPSHLKELVREEIRLLLTGLQQKALQEGRDQDGAIAKYSPRVVSFALKGSSGNSRPSSENSTLIRVLLQEECHALERYIAYLQGRLEEASQHVGVLSEAVNEPTMAELQEEKRAMERDLQQSQPKPCRSPSLMLKQHRSIYQTQLSDPGGSATGPNYGENKPASNIVPSPTLRHRTSPLCHQILPGWSSSVQDQLGWLHRDDQLSEQEGKASDPRVSRLVIPKGGRVVPAYKTVGPELDSSFHPTPPAQPCPLPRFCPRTRLVRCKGPS
uniref:Coiled-coil domain containing 24 n=1 Tax=Salvator merianae TaxID=96440 RepID=A0A8D0DZF1_SALMN